MAIFAVRLDVVQTLQTETEVVVQASSPAEALRAAKAELESVLPRSYGPSYLVNETMSAGEIRQVRNPEEDTIPYVYDLTNNRVFESANIDHDVYGYTAVKSQPETFSWETPVDLVVAEPLVTVDVSSTVNLSDLPDEVPWTPPQNTSDGPRQDTRNSFLCRPSAGVDRPKTTLPNGYTPLDHEIRKHAILPYYLQGPACVELGPAEYCGSTGVSQREGCPAPSSWTQPTAPATPSTVDYDNEDYDEDDWDESWENEDDCW